ncbi:hypothetical protein NDU88_001885 [Pleurodeles waltl]|uniref:Uncharacterized protein n=1 Tax=Pleurodeles waltl TaxID=8319 RepID=A0AAV7MTZ7_PLEWA|nr:hypothetical protein NDU88_001885 [Pleurodeles waltl]
MAQRIVPQTKVPHRFKAARMDEGIVLTSDAHRQYKVFIFSNDIPGLFPYVAIPCVDLFAATNNTHLRVHYQLSRLANSRGCQECDPEAEEPGWQLGPPGREEEQQDEPRRPGPSACVIPSWAGPKLRSVSSIGQRRGEPDPGGRPRSRAGLAAETTGPNGRTAVTNPGDLDPVSVWAQTSPVRGYEARAALGREEESRATVSDPGSG